jgi:hypothetical protein
MGRYNFAVEKGMGFMPNVVAKAPAFWLQTVMPAAGRLFVVIPGKRNTLEALVPILGLGALVTAFIFLNAKKTFGQR